MTYGEFRCHVLYYWWFSFVQSKKRRRKKRGKTRWVQTFLVVKRRNLQLSNKSLRLNPFCHWLKRATWHRRYEHELYAVVYSLVLPLYQQQTKLGRRNILFPFIVIFKEKKNAAQSSWHCRACYSPDPRLPDSEIFGTVTASTSRCLRLFPHRRQ